MKDILDEIERYGRACYKEGIKKLTSSSTKQMIPSIISRKKSFQIIKKMLEEKLNDSASSK